MRPGRAGLAVLAALAAALGPSRPAFAERDYDFARALWRAGYRDLALAEYQRLLRKEGVPPRQRARARFDLASIYQEEADQAGGPARRNLLLEKARRQLEQALAEASGDVVLTFSVRRRQALLLQNHARYLAGLLARPDFAGHRDKARAEALDAFQKSIAAFEALARDAKRLIDELEKQADPGARKSLPGLQNERVNARLRALWSRYYAALLFGKDSPERRRRLEEARTGFAAFAKEWDGYVISLYGHLGEGLARLELGEYRKAQAKFSLIAGAVRDKRAMRGLLARSLIYRAACYNALDQPSRAADDLEGALSALRRPERSELGRRALVELARALERMAEQSRAARAGGGENDGWRGLVRRALDAARKVARRPGPYRKEALDLITRLLGHADLAEAAASPAEVLAVAEAAFAQKRYRDAISGYRRAVELAGARQEDAALAARAWFGTARCYYFLRRYLEAAIVFEYVGQRYPRRPEGPRAAYLAVQCWLLASGKTRRASDRRAALASLQAALARYGDDPRIGELRILQGQLLLQEGRYEEALRAFQGVPENSTGYARAQFEAGICAYEWFLDLFRRNRLGPDRGKAQYEAAARHLKTYLGLVKKPAADAARRQRVGTARLVLAAIYTDLMGKPGPALEMLDFPFPADLEAKAAPLELKALIQAGRTEEALGLLKKVRASAGTDPKRLEDVLLRLGRAMDEQADKLRRQGDLAAYRAAADRTADFLLSFLRDNPDQEVEVYRFVASRLMRIERFAEAADVLKALIERFGSDPEKTSAVLAARLSLVESAMGLKCWREAIEQLTALQRAYPTSARLRRLLATCYVESGRPEKGIPILQDLFRNVYRGGTRPWYEVGLALARAYEKAGRKDRALGVTRLVKLLHAPFWNGKDRENLDLAEQYKEIHQRCGGK